MTLLPAAQSTETFQAFVGSYTVPADLPDGSYTTTYRVQSPSGIDIADPRPIALHVDAVPPALVSTSPAEGEEVTALQRRYVRFTGSDDRSGISCWNSGGSLTDVTAGTTVDIRGFQPRISPDCRSWDSYQLVAGHTYRVDLDIADRSGNRTPAQFSFVAYDGPAWTGNAPTGTVLSPLEPISVRYSPDVRWWDVRFRITRLTGGIERVVIPQIDQQSRTAFVRPGDVSRIGPGTGGNDDFYPPLLPGRYRVDLLAFDWKGQALAPYGWEFDVVAHA